MLSSRKLRNFPDDPDFDDLLEDETELDTTQPHADGLDNESSSLQKALDDDDDLLNDDLELFRGERDGIILCAIRSNATEPIGLAYYSELDRTVYVGEAESLETVIILKNRFTMSMALTSARAGDPLFEELRVNGTTGGPPNRVMHMHRLDYDDRNCKRLLQSVLIEEIPELRVGSSDSDTIEQRQARRFMWNSIIDFSKRTLVMALTGLLTHLLRNMQRDTTDAQDATSSSDHPSGALYLHAIKLIDATGLVYVDESTLQGLHIFVREMHPGLGRSSEKEGLGLYGLLNQTRTPQGSQLLRRWLRHPTSELHVLNYRLNHIEFFTRPENEDLLVQLRATLGQVRSIERSVNRFYNRIPRPADWRSLFACLQSIVSMHAIIVAHKEQLERAFHHSLHRDRNRRASADSRQAIPNFPQLLAEISSASLEELQVLNGLFVSILDLEALLARPGRNSGGQTQVCVRSGGDPDLDELRARLAVIDSFLAETLAEDLAAGTLPPVFGRINYCCLPHVGFLVVVPIEEVNVAAEETLASLPEQQRCTLENSVINAGAAAVAASAGLTVQFKTAEHVFFSNARTRELDQELGDLHTQVADIEREILEELAQQVMLASGSIEWFASRMAELDVILALALVARELNLVRPQLKENSQELTIQDGRHMVFELCVEQFIPNSISISKETGLVHIITGPNGSGKSVLLKQVGTIAYLAHIGSFVPAKSATIGLCDQICYSGTSEGSALNAYSTFATDVLKASFALRTATSRTLLLLDEFGVGTNSTDGIALCAGLVKYFDQLQSSDDTTTDAVNENGTRDMASKPKGCPKVLLTTHYHEMATMGLIQETDRVRFNSMKFVVSGADQEGSAMHALHQQLQSRGISGEAHGSKSRGGDPSAATTSAATVIPVFKLAAGWTDHSYGFSCAVGAGLPWQVVERAVRIIDDIESHNRIKPLPAGTLRSVFSGNSESGHTKLNKSDRIEAVGSISPDTEETCLQTVYTPDQLEEAKSSLKQYAKLMSAFVRAVPDLTTAYTAGKTQEQNASNAVEELVERLKQNLEH